MVTMVKFPSSLLVLACLAMLTACQPASTPSSETTPGKSDPKESAMNPAEIGAATEDGWAGTYASEDPQVLKDETGREIKMSPGFTEQLGGIQLELRADMTFEFTMFGKVAKGEWERPDPTTVLLRADNITYRITRNQSAGTILMSGEGKSATPFRLKKQTKPAP